MWLGCKEDFCVMDFNKFQLDQTHTLFISNLRIYRKVQLDWSLDLLSGARLGKFLSNPKHVGAKVSLYIQMGVLGPNG